MPLRPRTLMLLAGLATLGAFFGFANPLAHMPWLVLLLPAALAWAGLRAPSPGRAFRYGLLVGWPALTAGLYWIVIPVHVYGGLNLWLALPCPLLLACYIALYAGAFAWGVYTVSRSPRPLPWALLGIFAGCWWASLEMLREVLFSGFPWLALAASFGDAPVMIQSAAYVGSWGLGALLVCAATWLVLGGARLWAAPRLAAVGLLAGLALLGLWRVQTHTQEAGRFQAGIVQGNIDQSLKWDGAYQTATVGRYLEMSAGLLDRADREGKDRPSLIVWPETAMPFYLQDITAPSAQVRAFATEHDVALLTGAPAYRLNTEGRIDALFNRAYLVLPGSSLMAFYDKVHLVPFGEYVPLQDYLPLGPLVQAAGNFRPGEETGPLLAGDIALGVLICYETIFPELAQERVRKGAAVLVNISNDAWFGRSSAPWQHLHMSALRAVEQGRWIIRSTNTGVSAFIDPRGRILAPTPLFSAAAQAHEIERIDRTTFFHRWFTAVRLGLIALAVGLAVWAQLARRRTMRAPTPQNAS